MHVSGTNSSGSGSSDGSAAADVGHDTAARQRRQWRGRGRFIPASSMIGDAHAVDDAETNTARSPSSCATGACFRKLDTNHMPFPNLKMQRIRQKLE